ncbi:MAG TPA: hypothetical protein VFO85_01575, partial [Vicinamibacteria bacterium]|nr:hypothetical protein [Vicinamibacteria bacterium]
MARLAVDRARAWTALATNVAVLPGLGSLLLGRRVGWLQAPLAVAGFVLTVGWLALVLSAWMRDGVLPVGEVPRPRML